MSALAQFARETHSWQPIDLVATGSEPPDPPTLSGIAYPGRRHVWSGEPETLKSWAALVLGAEQIELGNSVVYIDLEMGRREMLARLHDLGVSDEEISDRFIYLEPAEALTDPLVLADVDALLIERRPTLVVIDAFVGMLSLHGLDPNSGVEVERFYRTVVDPLRAHGAAVLLLDHLTKAKDTRGKFSIGSERKIGGADIHLGFEIVRPFGRGRSGLAKILTHKDRPGHLPRPKAAEFELTSNAVTGKIVWEIRPGEGPGPDRPFRPTHLMEKVSLYIGSHTDGPPSRNKVEENITGKREYVRQAIDALVDEDFLAEEEGPRNARLLRSLKPYREDDDDGS